jgi:virginiamycin A acetyltransferase
MSNSMNYLLKNIIRRLIKPIKYELFRKKLFNTKYIKIEDNVSINSSNIDNLGMYTFIGANTVIGPGVVKVGLFCSIAPEVILGPNNHEITKISTSTFIQSYNSHSDFKKLKINKSYSKYIKKHNAHSTIIGNDVWIGYRAIIMSGVEIGDGAIVGSGSIVTKDVEPYSIVAGNPAKLIRYRFDNNTIDKILEADIYSFDSEKLFNIFANYKSRDLNNNMEDLIEKIMEIK